MGQKKFWPKKIGVNTFFVKEFFGQNFFLVKIFSGPTNFLVQSFLVNIIFYLKILRPKNFGLNSVWVEEILGQKCSCQKNLRVKKCLGQKKL